MRVDEKNNIVEVCLFESYLAKFFIDNPSYFSSLIAKIMLGVNAVIELNEDNSLLERMLFSVCSQASEVDANMGDLVSLQQTTSIVALDTFFKYFSEWCLTLPDLTLPKVAHSTGEDIGFFKSSALVPAKIAKVMRPEGLFCDEHRGVIDIETDEDITSTNFGLLSDDFTPPALVNVLTFNNHRAGQYYLPKEDSEMALWLRAHYLPVISGASGGVGKTISAVASIIDLSLEECALFGLMIAASTVALGHHSFFEVLRPVSFMTGELQEQATLLSFYEQMIPASIQQTEAYQAHMAGLQGAELLEGFKFQLLEDEAEAQEQLAL